MEEQKEKEFRKLVEILRKSFSEEELREIKDFLARIADLLIEVYIDGDLS